MNEFKQWIKDWLVDLNIIKAERQPELEQEYLEAFKKWRRIKTVMYLPTFKEEMRQPVATKYIDNMWVAKNKLLAAGYKEKDIIELRRGI